MPNFTWGQREVEARAGARSLQGPAAQPVSLGNQALQRLLERTGGHGLDAPGNAALARRAAPVQALREVGHADDRFEREAHAVADAIVDRPRPASGEAPQIQRIADPGAVGLRGVPQEVHSELDGARGRGRSLPTELASTMGQRLGADLGGVRVHTDARADRLSRTLGARAFTSGRDVFFRRGAYDPSGGFGRRVLAHELTHVVQQGGGGPRPPIQRFIMQVGNDDGYTTTMSDQLKTEHSDESFLKFSAVWDTNMFGIEAGIYEPKTWHKPKGTDKLPSYGPSLKLKGVPNGEKLRIVGHGNIYGKVGGYDGAGMAALIARLGLPTTHTGGVDVHGCLPASNWTDPDTQELKPAHIVSLEDNLGLAGYTETVRGYEHCIFPDIKSEIASSAYGVWEIGRALGNKPRDAKYSLSTDEKAKIRKVLGSRTDGFLASVTVDGTKVNDCYYFYWQLSRVLEEMGLKQTAKLIDTTQPRSELTSE